MSTEQDLNDQKIDAHYQSLPKDQPPPELNARILQAAHQAVKSAVKSSEPRVVKLHHRKKPMPWLKPLSYAAVMVLSLGVVLHIQTEIPQTIKAHPETFYFIPEVGETLEVYQVKELQQAEGVASAVASASAPAARILQEQPAPPPSPKALPQKLSRSLAAEHAAPMENKSAKTNSEMDRMKAAGASQMMDAASVTDPPAAVRAEKSKVRVANEAAERTVTEMMRLYHAGEIQALQLQLQAFVKDYPDYVLPKELQNVLRAGTAKP